MCVCMCATKQRSDGNPLLCVISKLTRAAGTWAALVFTGLDRKTLDSVLQSVNPPADPPADHWH